MLTYNDMQERTWKCSVVLKTECKFRSLLNEEWTAGPVFVIFS
jgi:hypothetical protein